MMYTQTDLLGTNSGPEQSLEFMTALLHYLYTYTHIHTHTHTHTQTTVLRPSWILSGTTQVSWHQKGKTRKVKPIWIYWSKRHWVAVASAGPYSNLHLDPDTYPCQHPTTQFFYRQKSSCHQTNSVKALKALFIHHLKTSTIWSIHKKLVIYYQPQH